MLGMSRRRLFQCTVAACACTLTQPVKSSAQDGFLCSTIAPVRGTSPDITPFNMPGSDVVSAPQVLRLEKEFKLTPFGVAALPDRWRPKEGLTPDGKVTLGVHFLNGEAAQHGRMRQIAEEWLQHGVEQHVAFAWDNIPRDRAQIRVRFGPPGGNWSRVGRHARAVTDLSNPTMNIQDLEDGIIRHEVGHALGMQHEHQHPNANIRWKTVGEITQAILADPRNQHWTDAHTQLNVTGRPPGIAHCVGDPRFHPDSVMMYPVDPKWNLDGLRFRPAENIKERDFLCVRALYSV